MILQCIYYLLDINLGHIISSLKIINMLLSKIIIIIYLYYVYYYTACITIHFDVSYESRALLNSLHNCNTYLYNYTYLNVCGVGRGVYACLLVFSVYYVLVRGLCTQLDVARHRKRGPLMSTSPVFANITRLYSLCSGHTTRGIRIESGE